ncbi:MAG: hypothetical protein RMY28_010355 [Nostoc sp. ChiSLP01]
MPQLPIYMEISVDLSLIAYLSGNNNFVDYRYSKKLTLSLPLGAFLFGKMADVPIKGLLWY